MDTREFDETKIPDEIGLRKQLSELNKKRYEFWMRLRAAQMQVNQFLNAHYIKPEEVDEFINRLPEHRREYFKCEWEMGRTIPEESLIEMMHETQVLAKTSLIEEDEIRKREGMSAKSWLFAVPLCENCALRLPKGRRKFCSDSCALEYRKRKYRRKQAELQKKQKKKTTPIEINPDSKGGPNPLPGEGQRSDDFNCSYYNECLDKAIKNGWPSFHCGRCPLK